MLEAGRGMPGAHSLPIGQVFFVPREEVSLRDLTEQEIEGIEEERRQFVEEKAGHRVTTRYGLEYSPHYAKESRARRGVGASHAGRGEENDEEGEDGDAGS